MPNVIAFTLATLLSQDNAVLIIVAILASPVLTILVQAIVQHRNSRDHGQTAEAVHSLTGEVKELRTLVDWAVHRIDDVAVDAGTAREATIETRSTIGNLVDRVRALEGAVR